MKRCGGCSEQGDPKDPYTMKVYAGSVDVRKATPYNVSRVSLPDNWKQPEGIHGDDVALLEVDREFEFTDYVQPICIPTNFTEQGPDPPVNASDWESTNVAYENIMPFRGDCGHGGQINPQNYFCAGQNMRTTHNGDSGGPLMINRKGTWFQVGVCSSGYGTNINFARVSSQCAWIEKETNGEVVCSDLPQNEPSAFGTAEQTRF
ncbi:oviductin [Aphelenchoides avenae]|nr:oviductin [Aphelenchus avenae]